MARLAREESLPDWEREVIERDARETLVMRVEVLEKHLAQQHERVDDLNEQLAKQADLIKMLQREVGL